MTDHLDSKHFCMAPWIHLHIWPNGNVYPCCIAPSNKPFSSTRQESLETIWNGEQMRELRRNMLADQPSETCRRCYDLERNGSWSTRRDLNRKFCEQIDIVDLTEADGSLPEMNIKYMDIRLSNICNFKCRSCGPQLSSKWYDDNVIMFGETSRPRIDRPFATEEELWEVLVPILDTVEEIYFAGGEPLVTPEHYQILEYLIEHKRTDVRILYNTNFGKLHHAGKDVLEYWKQFNDVRVGASLDAAGERAEYMRSGTVWSRIEENMRRVKTEAPHVSVFISATVSLYNVWHLPDFYSDWLDKELIRPHDLNINVLHHPPDMSVTVLPHPLKDRVNKKYREMMPRVADCQVAYDGLQSILNFMNSQDDTHLIPTFFERNDLLDEIRKENFELVFPELRELRDYNERK